MKVKSESEVAQSCLTLSDPMDCSLPGSSVHGIFQAKVLEWGAIAFSKYKTRSCVYLCMAQGMKFNKERIALKCKFSLFSFLNLSRDQGGEGNGTPLQDSCLENLMDGGAW